MPQGPYRRDAEAWVDPPAPRGIVFRGEDDRLTIEVNEYHAVFTTTNMLSGMITSIAAVHGGQMVLGAFGVLITLAAGLDFVRPRSTRIEMAGDRVTFTQRVPLLTVRERSFTIENLGPPRVEVVKSGFDRGPCLRFDHRLAGAPGGEQIPVDVLLGYPRDRLEWLRGAIVDWMEWTNAQRRRAGGGA
jgi:hypothetical protein